MRGIVALLGGVVGGVRGLALVLGGPGLALVAFLDSTFLPLPGITDLLVVVMVTRHKPLMLWYVATATAGSVLGCLVLHVIGRRGGEALIRRSFTSARVERAMASLQRHGVMAVLIPSILPPPAPFKVFVLLAGAVRIGRPRFATAVALGRGGRYLALGVLAVLFGQQALAYVATHATAVSLVAAGALAAGFAAYLAWSKAREARNR